MIYGFVKQSNGHIKIYSEQGHGTTVRIYLPEAGRPAEPAAMAPSQNIEGGHETILIVEDDPLVRAFVVGIVESFGYVALTAVNAVEALAYIKSNSEIDLLFTDMILPGVFNGRQLAEIARQSRPLLKVLFTSGYSNETIIHNGHLDADVLMLTKPYRRLDLSQMIRTALAGCTDTRCRLLEVEQTCCASGTSFEFRPCRRQFYRPHHGGGLVVPAGSTRLPMCCGWVWGDIQPQGMLLALGVSKIHQG
jgi:CheY-like chemotaxis protein